MNRTIGFGFGFGGILVACAATSPPPLVVHVGGMSKVEGGRL
jgi:hypothetical protein